MNLSRKVLFSIFIFLILAFGVGATVFYKNANKSADDSIISVYNSIPTETGKKLYYKQSAGLSKPVDPELVDLDSQVISCSPSVSGLSGESPSIGGSCVGPGAVFDAPADQLNLGGQCCGAMLDTHMYHEQLEALKKYSNITDIPPNPYKTPVELAKKLIEYDQNTTLTSEQQKIYDDAFGMSEEGPCCCKCWHWYVNEGLAKKLIIEYNFTAEQVAEVWDISDICGGSGHVGHGE